MGLLNFFSSLFGKAKQTAKNTNEKKSELTNPPVLEKVTNIVEDSKESVEKTEINAEKTKVKKTPSKKPATKEKTAIKAEKTKTKIK